MKNIGSTGKPITSLQPKRDNKTNNQLNTKKNHSSTSVQIETEQTEDIKRQALKVSIHKKLQDIDLSNPEGRRLGREAFVELSLKQEFKDQPPDFLHQHQLIAKIEDGVFQAPSIRNQLDKLIRSLKKSV